MQIDRHTKISAIIKANGASIDAIAALAKPLEKLKNPILRKLMSSRVTVAEAATLGGVSIEDFKQALEPLGFIFIMDTESQDAQSTTEPPLWYSALTDTVTDMFDVRPIIENGNDPLKLILQRYDRLPSGHALCIINSFVPTPLFYILEKKGAKYHVDTKSKNLHYTWFLKHTENTLQTKTIKPGIQMMDTISFEHIFKKYERNKVKKLDVSGLPMPQPMERILETLATLQQDEILHIHHSRIPLHLLEELDASSYTVYICEYSPEDIQLLLFYNIP